MLNTVPSEALSDDVVELRLLRVLAPGDEASRPPAARFLARVPELRFAIHRRSDGARVGRIHLRITADADVVRAVGHSGYEVDESHRRQGYAARDVVPTAPEGLALGLGPRVCRYVAEQP